MLLVAVVIFSFLPCLLYLWYGTARGLFSPPRGLYTVSLSLSAIVVAVACQLALSPLSAGLHGWSLYSFEAFISTSLTEEGVRLALLYLACRGIQGRSTSASLALLAGLAFASFENIAYGIRYPGLVALRYLTAVPVHAAASLLCWRTLDGKRPWGALSAFTLHGLYALGLVSERPWLSVCALLLASRYLVGFRRPGSGVEVSEP